jgi:hypothetical protein
MSKSILTKEVRADYTGKLVTRTVKVETGARAAKSLPSPALASSKSEAALEEEYRLMHKAPYRDDEGYFPTIDNISQMIGEDVYTNPEWYSDTEPDPEAVATLLAVRGKPDAVVPIYRSVPKGVTDINAGDWVTTSRAYAERHGAGITKSGEFDLLVAHVPASDLFTEGNSIEEFGYDGETIKPVKKHYNEMTDDEKREYIPDLMQRQYDASSIIDESMEANPTIENAMSLFDEHKGIINESMQYAIYGFDSSSRVPGHFMSRMINDRLEQEAKMPDQVGGVRVRLIANGKDRTVELYGDDPAPGRSVDQQALLTQAIKKLRIKTDYDLSELVNKADMQSLNGAGAEARYAFDEGYTQNELRLQYAEVTHLPVRSEEFVKQHGGTAAVADGWL